MSLMTWIALGVIALWVLFSGGTPALKFILYRLLFVLFVAASAIGTIYMYQQSGIGAAILTVMGLTVLWSVLIGPLISMPLYFRKNPKELPNN
jgi:hypothetical protein